MSATDIIKAALPTLATALGGPLAGMAAQFFASKLGLPESTVEAVKNAVSGASPPSPPASPARCRAPTSTKR